ncbi:hypothetical protein [Prescottella equi]|uniref:hypothetical protein n=1 Tax=Rhodococcus hoagii TaxID=43767 RepID=UPI00111C281F|nr:hypothetical protein [Prescottella equi]
MVSNPIVDELEGRVRALLGSKAQYDPVGKKVDPPELQAHLNATYASASRLGAVRPASPVAGVPLSTEAYATAVSSISMKTEAGTSKVPHVAGFDASELRMTIHNWLFSGSSAFTDQDGAAPLPARAAFMVGGKIYPVTFRGSRDVTVDPGGYITCDPLGVEVAKGETFYTLIYTSSTSWKPNRISYTSSDSGGFVATTDATASGSTIPADGASGLLAPALVTGVPAKVGQRTVAIAGDSIASGAGDGYNGTAHPVALGAPMRAGGGYLARALRGRTGTVQVAQPSDLAQNFRKADKHFRRGTLVSSATDAICEYGINDLGASLGHAVVKQELVNTWMVLARRGLRVWQPTLTPYSTSSNGWITTAGQTPFSGAADRVQVNDWIRDGAPITGSTPAAVGASGGSVVRAGQPGHPLHSWWEAADAVESSRNSGRWMAPERTIADGEMTVGSRVLTSATAAFTSADLYKPVTVAGAGASGATLSGFIGAVLSATQVNLSNSGNTALNAATAVTGTAAGIGTPTTDGVHPSAITHAILATTVPVDAILAD